MKRAMSIVGWIILILLVSFFAAGYFAIKVAHVPITAGLIYGMLAAHWLVTVAACILAFRWTFASPPRRFVLSVILALFALASSWWGMKVVHVTSTQAVNGRTQYLFDSRWLFMGTIVLAMLAFAFALWKKLRFKSAA